MDLMAHTYADTHTHTHSHLRILEEWGRSVQRAGTKQKSDTPWQRQRQRMKGETERESERRSSGQVTGQQSRGTYKDGG